MTTTQHVSSTAPADWAATIDCGTSNTRVRLWHLGVRVRQAERPVGVRDTVLTGSRAVLQDAVRGALLAAMSGAGLVEDAPVCVLASGMITSGAGLLELPHLAAPAGLAELAEAMTLRAVDGWWARPVWWVPGVRSQQQPATLADAEAFDMMRGEETEVMGLLDRLQQAGEALLVLPGSHTKLIRLDAQGRIAASATTLGGELLQVLSQNTLLAASVGGGFVDQLDLAALDAGAQATWRSGLSRAVFGARILDVKGLADRHGRASYLLGAVLAADVQALLHSPTLQLRDRDRPVWVAGRASVRDGLVHLLRSAWPQPAAVLPLADDLQDDLAGWGALVLARHRGLLAPFSV